MERLHIIFFLLSLIPSVLYGAENRWNIYKDKTSKSPGKIVEIDGKKYGPFDEIKSSPLFSSDGKHWVFAARMYNVSVYEPRLFEKSSNSYSLKISPALFSKRTMILVIHNGKTIGKYKNIYKLGFCSKGLRFLFEKGIADYYNYVGGKVTSTDMVSYSKDYEVFIRKYRNFRRWRVEYRGKKYGPYKKVYNLSIPLGLSNPDKTRGFAFCFKDSEGFSGVNLNGEVLGKYDRLLHFEHSKDYTAYVVYFEKDGLCYYQINSGTIPAERYCHPSINAEGKPVIYRNKKEVLLKT